MSLIVRLSYMILSCFCLTACGFKLQSTDQMLSPQLQKVYIDTSSAPHSAIAPDLTLAFENNKVSCVTDPQQAHIILNILQEKQSSYQIGSGASQETRKYELINAVTFTLNRSSGERLYGPVTVTSSLIHYVYSGQVLGNSQEEDTLYQSLHRDLIQKIIFKLSSIEANNALLINNSTT